jgi:CBS domain-containing protein
MSRYRNDRDYDDEYAREEQFRRHGFGDDRPRPEHWRPEYSGNRFGERAEYYRDEPRYRGEFDRVRDEGRRSSLYDIRGDLTDRRRGYNLGERSRLRCRDIMTRDLVVATRDTTLREVALMMKQEDTGVIPVVDYDIPGNGKSERDERKYEGRNYSRGKLIGLLTDRDIAVRAVAEAKDVTTTRAEETMSKDLHVARPNDRVVEVIRKMGDKQVRRIPVVNENGYLVGLISMADIAIETQQDTELSEALEDISKSSGFWSKFFGDGF